MQFSVKRGESTKNKEAYTRWPGGRTCTAMRRTRYKSKRPSRGLISHSKLVSVPAARTAGQPNGYFPDNRPRYSTPLENSVVSPSQGVAGNVINKLPNLRQRASKR